VTSSAAQKSADAHGGPDATGLALLNAGTRTSRRPPRGRRHTQREGSEPLAALPGSLAATEQEGRRM
jgi:hypothetical protein